MEDVGLRCANLTYRLRPQVGRVRAQRVTRQQRLEANCMGFTLAQNSLGMLAILTNWLVSWFDLGFRRF